MELKRKAYDELLRWKGRTPRAKALMVKGARRVGKSYLVSRFAKREYRSHILIDFASPPNGVKRIFDMYGNREQLNEFFNQLSVLFGTKLYPGNSLLVFDEVQKYPKARELVKYLVEDGRYDCIETGSLISIKKNVKDIVIPSEEEELLLHPLDFGEFLLALSDETTVPFLEESYRNNRPLGNLLKPVMEKLRLYMMVGGLPQAVVSYASTGSADATEAVKRGILKVYREDIAKYAEHYVAEATALFNSIPSQLAHHDKKIKYSSLGEGDRFRSYRDALFWMADSMVGSLSMCVEETAVFGGFSVKPQKLKCYMGDTGLLLTLAAGENYLRSELYKSFMLGKLSVNQGMMTENLVAQMLVSGRHPLHFYEKRTMTEAGAKKYEVDFLLADGERTTPIEVKSGNSRNHPSLDFFRKTYGKRASKGILLTKGDLRETEEYRYLPLPMAMFL